MHADPVVALSIELRAADHAFDRAASARNTQAADAAGEQLIALSERFDAAVPSTPQGAALKLRDAIGTLSESTDPLSFGAIDELTPIANQLARGRRSLSDIIALRAFLDAARGRLDDDSLQPIETALKGMARPTLASSSQH